MSEHIQLSGQCLRSPGRYTLLQGRPMLTVLCSNPEPDVCRRRNGSLVGTTVLFPSVLSPSQSHTMGVWIPTPLWEAWSEILYPPPHCSLNHQAGSIQYNIASPYQGVFFPQFLQFFAPVILPARSTQIRTTLDPPTSSLSCSKSSSPDPAWFSQRYLSSSNPLQQWHPKFPR